MNPPRKGLPLLRLTEIGQRRRHYDARHCANISLGIGDVPDMMCVIPLVRSTFVLIVVLCALRINGRRSVSRSDTYTAENALNGLQNLNTQMPSSLDGNLWIIWDVWNAFDLRYF